MVKENRITIRIPEYLDKQITKFAETHFPDSVGKGDYSKAIRFLCQLGLIVSKRLGKELITLSDEPL